MKPAKAALVLGLCLITLLGSLVGGDIRGATELVAAELGNDAAISVKIGPSLAARLDMEKTNFPVPSDSREAGAIASMRKSGAIGAYLRSDHQLSDSEMNAVETLGVALPARGSPVAQYDNSYEAVIPLDRVRDAAALPFRA